MTERLHSTGLYTEKHDPEYIPISPDQIPSFFNDQDPTHRDRIIEIAAELDHQALRPETGLSCSLVQSDGQLKINPEAKLVDSSYDVQNWINVCRTVRESHREKLDPEIDKGNEAYKKKIEELDQIQDRTTPPSTVDPSLLRRFY